MGPQGEEGFPGVDGIDGTDGDAMLEQERLPLLVRFGEEGLLECGDELNPVLHPGGIGGEAGVIHQGLQAHDGAEDAPEPVAADRQGQIFRLGPKGLIGQQGLVGRPHRLGHDPVGQIGADGPLQQA